MVQTTSEIRNKMETKYKACKDCKHCELSRAYEYLCSKTGDKIVRFDPYLGSYIQLVSNMRPIQAIRTDESKCGMNAAWFERKDPTMSFSEKVDQAVRYAQVIIKHG
jgi:hypothetical protein